MPYFRQNYVRYSGNIVAAMLPLPGILPLGLGRSTGPVYDPDAKAVIDQVLAVGGTLSGPAKTGINNFVLTLKSAGIWSFLSYVYGMAGGTNASHAINWKNPTGSGITWNGTVTSDNTGSHGDGTSYGDLGLNAFNLATDNFCLIGSSGTSGADGGLNVGGDDGAAFLWIGLNHNGSLDVISGSFGTRALISNTSSGVAALEVSGPNRVVYLNGASAIADTPTVTMPNINIWCFGRNDNGALADGNTKNINFMGAGQALGGVAQSVLSSAITTLRAALL